MLFPCKHTRADQWSTGTIDPDPGCTLIMTQRVREVVTETHRFHEIGGDRPTLKPSGAKRGGWLETVARALVRRSFRLHREATAHDAVPRNPPGADGWLTSEEYR